MTDKQPAENPPAPIQAADDRFGRIERIVRWAFWIGLAAVIAWFFIDVLIKH